MTLEYSFLFLCLSVPTTIKAELDLNFRFTNHEKEHKTIKNTHYNNN